MTDNRNFLDYYEIGKELGDGNFSIVKECKEIKTGMIYAVKCINKNNLSLKDRDNLENELKLLKQLNHPRIVKLHDVFDCDKKTCYIVMELMKGGELFDRIIEKEHYTEAEAKQVISTVCKVLEYCHDRGIAHRDLKPENLLYESKDEDARIKVADFGFAKETSETNIMSTMCGTPGYFAPEVIKRESYELKCDIWSLGVILYILLCGFPPFYDENQAKEIKLIQMAKFDYPSPYFDNVSDEAKDLINQMLVINTDKRFSAKEVLNHKWMKDANIELSKDVLNDMPKLKIGTKLSENKAIIKNKFKAGVGAILMINQMKRKAYK